MIKVSIIVSVLNRAKDISRLINSIMSQSYENFELIIVDNGSVDSTVSIIQSFNNEKLTILDGSRYLGSPYSARNMGVKASTGGVIAFMDGYPEKDWLTNSVSYMQKNNLDIVGGKVILEANKQNDSYELFDSIFSLDVGHMVTTYKSAPTANLLINLKVFTQLGLFNENVRSGGDIYFTSKASKAGFNIGFCDLAVSKYFTRTKKQLILKQKRVALGQVNIWYAENKVVKEVLKTFVKLIIPFSPFDTIKRVENNSNCNLSYLQIFKIYLIRHKLDRIRLWQTILTVSNRKKL